MKSSVRLQWIILIAGLILFVLLFFANRKPVKSAQKTEENKQASSAVIPYSEIAEKKLSALTQSEKSQWKEMEFSANSSEDASKFDSLIHFWDLKREPGMSSWFSSLKAAKSKKATDWFRAGERFYYGVRFIKNPVEVKPMYNEAIRCIESGLKLDSGNIDAKVLLAGCWVEGSDDPMKGIGMLREIEKTDSNNINLQLSFAAFSAKSAQWEKAIARYKKVIRINPDYLEAYLYLADAYEKMGNKNSTIESLVIYRDKVKDPEVKKEINVYIENLKK